MLPDNALHAFNRWEDLARSDLDPLEWLAHGDFGGAWALQMEAVPENPDWGEEGASAWDYRVVIPVTGGMDSSTLWAMAGEAGLPRVPVYVNMGQPYAKAEVETFETLFGRSPLELQAPDITRQWGHILPARNAIALLTIARSMQEQGFWGEVWFGALAGEMPARLGDKSARFLGTTQQLMAALGYDAQIVTPLRGMDKTDLVRWWDARGQLDTLRHTKSCFDPQRLACGTCQSCFRKMVAFRAAGFPTDGMFWDHNWAPFVHKYEPAMRDAMEHQDWSRYSPARCKDTLYVINRLREEGEV